MGSALRGGWDDAVTEGRSAAEGGAGGAGGGAGHAAGGRGAGVLARTVEHLEHDHAEGPPVDRLAVALLQDELGREVLGRAAQRPRAVLDVLGEAKVDELERPVLRD